MGDYWAPSSAPLLCCRYSLFLNGLQYCKCRHCIDMVSLTTSGLAESLVLVIYFRQLQSSKNASCIRSSKPTKQITLSIFSSSSSRLNEYCLHIKTKGTRRSKFSQTWILKTAWHKTKVMPCLGPLGSNSSLILALKQGIAWHCKLRSIWNIAGQIF